MPRGRSYSGGSCNYAYNTANIGGAYDSVTHPVRTSVMVENALSDSSVNARINDVIVITDGTFFVNNAGLPYPATNSTQLYWYQRFIHNDASTTLFIDGHAKAIKPEGFAASTVDTDGISWLLGQ
jgi:prepilin-type processing-associated H-X9-DG protein